MNRPAYQTLVEHYTRCFAKHGATPQGVDWPRSEEAKLRQHVMLELMGQKPEGSLLDLGCGYGALKDVADEMKLSVQYRGIDLCEPMIAEAKKRHANAAFEVRDILQNPLPAQSVDYVVMNGVFTEKRELSFEAMEAFMHGLVKAAFAAARKGIAFNVMSAHVDYERDDLFHLPFDRLATFLKAEISRHYLFRADYGPYEYTAYVYREAGSL